MIDLREISRAVEQGRARETSELINRAMEEGCGIENIVKEGLIAGMAAAENRYGRENPCAFEMLIAVRAVNMGIKALRGALGPPPETGSGTVILGAVKDDCYDVEKNLMALMMRLEGLRVEDLGVSVSPERFISAARAEDAQIIACSAARLGAMVHMKNLVQIAGAMGVRNRVKIIVTGKPVTDQFRAIIGADYYAPDAASAAEIAAAYYRRSLRPAA
jgi:methanogenic corrinoid protein MtbC1